jgi:anti-sigma regulatory factor (Ser/Thr protein kinase)
VTTSRTLRFAPDPAILAAVRRFAVDAAVELGCSVDHDDLLLVTGELAANAAVHQQGDAEITLSRTGDGGVHIAVFDPDPVIPEVVRHQPWDADGHRGLFLVEAVSESWGVDRRAEGKVVWARLAAIDVPPVRSADQRVDPGVRASG